MSSKRYLVAQLLPLAGISDPRTVAALSSLADARFQFGPSAVNFEPENITAKLQFTVNDEPVSVEMSIRGKLTQQLETILEGLELKNPVVPANMQPSPSEKTDFLSPRAVADAARLGAMGIPATVESGGGPAIVDVPK